MSPVQKLNPVNQMARKAMLVAAVKRLDAESVWTMIDRHQATASEVLAICGETGTDQLKLAAAWRAWATAEQLKHQVIEALTSPELVVA